jgi:hypothetical protein
MPVGHHMPAAKPIAVSRPNKAISIAPAQIAIVRRLSSRSILPESGVDHASESARLDTVKLRHLKAKLSRLNLTEAAREASALKAQFRREDEELYRQGRGAEVLADRKKNLGIADSGTIRLVTVNGVRIES